MTNSTDSLGAIAPDAIQALMDGQHGDPFAILGPHTVGSKPVVRALAHGAQRVEVVSAKDKSALGDLTRVHDGGLFSGLVSRDDAYVLRIHWPTAAGVVVQETEDPYAFGLLLSDFDLHLVSEGTHYDLARCLGAQILTIEGVEGVRFAVWAPNAKRVSVVGEFDAWDGRRHPMRLRMPSGVWELFVPRLSAGTLYKFEIVARSGALLAQKADPMARASEAAPSTASIVVSSKPFAWTDQSWLDERPHRQRLDAPISIYEVHAGSWARLLEEGGRSLTWSEMAERLLPYVVEMGFTHIEFLPITEYPFGGSWGYQPLGMFAPTGRYGIAEDFAYLVDRFHAAGVGVIVDWVPAHFPTDVWGLAQFDGSALYEHADPREGYHQDWNSLIYNLGRKEVKGFLIASALEWIEHYHVDAIRVDAVASMLYRDYSRKQGEWIPNMYGGRENLESVEFFRHLNSIIAQRDPGVLTIAEESTAWPGVTQRAEDNGLGFSLKWNMGWMHDTLQYMEKDPVYRSYQHHAMTFAMVYAYSERFVLPLSHDEVVHGKGSLINKMPGDLWQKFANLRAYFGWMWAFPGKKLLFMGCEIAQWAEWNNDASLDWNLLDYPFHRGMQALVRDLNGVYKSEPALYATDNDPSAFQWSVSDDWHNSVYAFVRRAPDGSHVLAVSNMTPITRYGYAVRAPAAGEWREIFNSDSGVYGGSNNGNGGRAYGGEGEHGETVVRLTLPGLSTLLLAHP